MSRTAVVGLGLIGGSVALAAGARGWDRDAEVRARARSRGIETPESLAEAVTGAGIVVAAVSTTDTPAVLFEIAAAAPEALLTDCTSLKNPIVEAAKGLPAACRFVGGHPMAGGSGRGVGAADPQVFRGRPWALVPTPRSDPPAVSAIEGFVRSLGARPVVLDADRHDRAMTWVSHLPLAVSAALARAAASGAGADLAALAGPGLLGATRLASQPEGLSLELALADPDALARAVERVRSGLDELARLLRGGDQESVRRFFTEAAATRRALEGNRTESGVR